MFQILKFTEAHVASVTNRVERHGDDERPAVSIGLEITVANTMLDLIDPKIREALYVAVEGQDDLPGVEKATPVLRCHSFERVVLTTSYDGWTLAVDDGVDDTTPMVFGGVKADKFSVDGKQGGSSVLKLRVGTSDVDADKLGKLAMHNGQSIWITLTAPDKPADAIDASSSADDLPPDATDLFSADEQSGETEADGAPDRGDNWPFPGPASNGIDTDEARSMEQRETSRPSTRTARGRAQTKAALAEGLAAHEASGA